MDVAERIARSSGNLTVAERRVAEAILDRPADVAFGTVAELAAAARAGAATVLRLASKLGFDGFTALQSEIQHELANQLRPAAQRIREPRGGDDPIERQLQLELGNVRSTLAGLDAGVFARIVAMCAATSSHLLVLSGEASRGIALQFVADLSSLRDGVTLVDGNEVAVRRQLALADRADTMVAIDYRRYDRWLLEVTALAVAGGLDLVAITDSVLSPIAAIATESVVVAAASTSPFDSHVGTLAALNTIVAGVADVLRVGAAERLARVEQAWAAAESLTDR
jgi:DNA-binding MurR/RpiR family transcriptional regulator